MATIRSLGFSIFTRYDGSGIREAARDIREFGGSIRSSTNSLNSWSGRIILAAKAAAVFGPALVPIAAHLASIGAAATAMGASVGSGLAAYGAAMKGAITQTLAARDNITKLRAELDKQKATLAGLTPGTEAYRKQLREVAATQKELDAALRALSPTQRGFIQATDQMSAAWKRLIEQTRDKTLATATHVVRGLTAGIGLLKPIIDALHPTILQASKAFETWMRGDSAKNYANLIKASAVPALQNLVAAGKDVINVLGDGFRAFLPRGVELTRTIREGAAALRQWSDGGGFQGFLQYVRDTAPQVREFFQALWDALKNIGTVMRELAPVSLGLVTVFLKVIAAIPPDLLQALVIAFMAWRAAVLLVNAAMLLLSANPIVLVITAIIAAIYLLVTNWETVSNAFKTAWNATWNFIKQVAEAVWNGLKAAWQSVCNLFSSIWTSVSGAISTAWSAVWGGLRTAAEAVWNAIKTAWQAVCGFFATAWSAVSGPLKAAWDLIWNGIKTVAEGIWGALKAAWEGFVNGLRMVWDTVSGPLKAAWDTLWNGIKAAAEVIWNGIKAAWELFVNTFKTIWDTVSAIVKAAWDVFWNGLKATAELVWNALKAAWELFINGLKTVWDTVSALVKAAWDLFWNGLKTAAEAVWTALKAAWELFINGLKTVWDTVSTLIKAAWDLFWNGLKTAAETIWNLLKAAWDLFLNGIKTAWDAIAVVIKAAWDVFWNGLKTAAETIWNLLKAAWDLFLNAIKTAWDTVSELIKTVWEAVWGWIKDTAQRIWDEVKQLWEDFINGIKRFWDTVSEEIKSAWETVWNWLKTTADRIWHEIGEIIEKAINAVLGLVKKVVGAWNTIAGAVGLDSLKIDTSDWSVDFNFATGGVVEFANGGIAGGMPMFKAGGVLPGYAPGRDTVPAMLSRGEGILVPEAVRGLGPNFVHWANYHFSHGRGGKNVAFPGYAKGGIMSGCAELPGYARGGIVAFARDPQNEDGWGTHFFQGGGVVMAAPEPPNPGVVGPGGIIVGGDASTSPDAADVRVGDGDPLGVGVITGGIENMMKTGGMVLGFLGRAVIEKAFDFAISFLDNFGMAGDFGKMLVAGTKKIVMGMIDSLVKKDEEAKQQFTAMSVAGTQSVQGWAPLAAKALQIAGLDPSQLQRFLALMMKESGGNPNAINGWDINAKNGVPSQGLMQVIPPTFAAYRDPSLPNNILDPLANMVASANYIQARYGGQVPGSPYADGTSSATPGLHLVGEEGPELVTGPGYANFGGGEQVFPAAQTASILDSMGPAVVTPQLPASGMPETAMLQSPMMEQMQSFGGPPQVEGWFGPIIGAAQHMLTTVQTAWNGTVAAGTAAQPAITATTTAVGNEVGVQIPANLETMANSAAVNFTAMATSAATNWQAMTAAAQTNWNTQLSTVYTPAETHMGTTMLAMSLAMQTAHDLAWVTMNATSLAQWTIMRDTTYAEAELHLGTTMPQMSVTMQTAHDLAWTTMQATSLAQWTLIRDGQILPFEEHMSVTMPAAAEAMNEAVSAAFTAMVETIVAQLDTAIAKIEEFIAATERAIAAAEALAAAQAAAAASGGGGGGSLGAASGSAEAALAAAGISPGMIVQGPYSNSVAASAGTHSGGGVYDIAGGPELLPALHAAGFAAWYRDWPGNQHIHAVYSGATDLSPQARWQLEDFRRGGSGLGIPGNLARGSTNAPPGWTWVGEQGPELLRMRGGEEVMPHLASSMFANALRRRRGWNPKKSQFFRSEGGRREFTSLMEANAGSVRGSVSDGGGINVEFNFNGPVSNGDDVRRAVDEAIPKLRTALQAGTGRRIGG
ncbi:transglycosylase SLT domain-containing protein [Streptomyces sp. NPDC057854]|uniref:transglycosylase SLT domain-containing protein n=1 Tax=unclassified Streptomyces TaxID=2593676 RepID=UPI0036A5CD6C